MRLENFTRAISLISGLVSIYILTFYFKDKMEYDLDTWLNLVIVIFLLKYYSLYNARYLIFGFESKMRIIILISVFFTILSPYTLFVTYPLLLLKSKYYSIENIYGQSIAFFLPFMHTESFFHIEGAAKAFVLINGVFLYSAGYEKLISPLWQKGKAVEGFLSLPYLIKPWAFLTIKKFSFLGNFIVLFEFLFIFSLFTPTTSIIFQIFILGFGISLFTILDISYIGQLLVTSMIGCLLIWTSHEMDIVDWSINNIVVFLIVSFSLINCFYPTKLLSNIMKLTTGAVTSIKVFTEVHLTGVYTYKFKKNGEDILMAFDKDGLFHKSQLFTSRYKQSAMYKITDYCLGAKNERDIADIAFQAARGDTVTLCVKPYDALESYEEYKNSSWHEITELSFDDSFIIRKLNRPPYVKTFRKI